MSSFARATTWSRAAFGPVSLATSARDVERTLERVERRDHAARGFALGRCFLGGERHAEWRGDKGQARKLSEFHRGS